MACLQQLPSFLCDLLIYFFFNFQHELQKLNILSLGVKSTTSKVVRWDRES